MRFSKTIMLDTLTVARMLTDAGFEPRQADALAAAIRQAAEAGDHASRTDLAELRAESRSEITEFRAEVRSQIAELRAEVQSQIAKLRAEVQSQIAELRAEVQSEIAKLRTDLASRDSRLTWRFAGAMLAQTGLIVALIRLLG